jgi:hypothetical protein
VLEHRGHRVAGEEDVGVAEHEQGPHRGAGHETQRRLQDHGARPLGAHQGASHVATLLGQQLVEVVARHPPGDVDEAAADQLAVAISDRAQAGVDLTPPPALADDAGELLVAGGPDVQAQAVVGEDLQLLDVVSGAAGHDRMDPAGVVADHAAEGAAVVGGGVGTEGEVVGLGSVTQVVEDGPGLDTGSSASGVELDHPVHVLGEVDDHGHVAALAGETGASAA